MHLEPMTTILSSNGINSKELAFFLTYSGILFDLLIGFFLIMKRTRFFAAILVILFNVTNHFLFDDINIFPFFMMGSLVILFELNELSFFSKYDKFKLNTAVNTISNKLVLYGLSIYINSISYANSTLFYTRKC